MPDTSGQKARSDGPLSAGKGVSDSCVVQEARPERAGMAFDRGVCSAGWAIAATSTIRTDCGADKAKRSVAFSSSRAPATGKAVAEWAGARPGRGAPALTALSTPRKPEDGETISCPRSATMGGGHPSARSTSAEGALAGRRSHQETLFVEGPVSAV